MRLLLFFIFGVISGFLALNLELAFETLANQIANWRQIQRLFFGIVLRQFVEVGPIEEGCKLVAVIAPVRYLQNQYRLRSSTVFLFSIAVALGFTAEESWVYLFHGFQGVTSIIERLISTPVHAMFSAPWGYALAVSFGSSIYLNKNRKLLPKALLNSVACHALVNILSMSGRFPLPLRLLSYGLFPFLLWMFWRLEQLLRRVEGKDPITLISGRKPKQRYWQKFLLLCALLLSGHAIFALFLLVQDLSLLSPIRLFYTHVMFFIMNRLLVSLIFGLLAWLIYRYLRNLARRRRYY